MTGPATAVPLTLHASTVAIAGRGVLIRGASGSGKSALALALLARGAALVADDRTRLARRAGGVLAWAPRGLLGLVEARGVGLLRADPAAPAHLAVVVDLDQAEPHRLPPARHCDILGVALPLVPAASTPHIADALLQWMKTGDRAEP